MMPVAFLPPLVCLLFTGLLAWAMLAMLANETDRPPPVWLLGVGGAVMVSAVATGAAAFEAARQSGWLL